MAGNVLIIAQQIQALIIFLHPTSVIQGWQISLLMIAAMILATAVNVYGIRLLPGSEMMMVVVHVLGFFAVLFPLWLMGELSTADQVFTTIQDNAGWGSNGLACLVGLLGPTVTLVGGDSACHLAEETKHASKALPLAMISTAVVNYTIALVMTITILFVSGNFDSDLATTTGQPWLAVFYATTNSRAACICIVFLLIILFFFCTINCITTASRQIYAFARDGGLPGSETLSKVGENQKISHDRRLLTSSY